MGDHKIKVAFPILGSASWYGGKALIYSVLRMLRSSQNGALEPWLLLQEQESAPKEFEGLIDGIIDVPREVPSLVSRLRRKWTSFDSAADDFFRKNAFDLVAFDVSPSKLSVPSLRYIPDFQHRRLPEMFPTYERETRDQEFAGLVGAASCVVVTAECVKKDLTEFFPEGTRKTRIVRPVWDVPSTVYETDPRTILRKYNLPDRFVYLPNQFWKHKNHDGVFRAVKRLRDRGTRVSLVCTGHPHDFRSPSYFGGLLNQIAELNLRDAVHLLGFVSLEEVFILMRQSVSVINPSLFEGLGLSVEQARSLGKQLLLSDIPAHREHAAPSTTYFDPTDVEAIASALEEAWNHATPGPDRALEDPARNGLKQRLDVSAKHFIDIIREVVG